MKAAFIPKHGGNEVLTVGELPDPVPGPGEVLVGVRAAALNRLDVFVRNGIPGVPVAFPSLDDLLASKRACGRPQDLLDAGWLEKAKKRLERSHARLPSSGK